MCDARASESIMQTLDSIKCPLCVIYTLRGILGAIRAAAPKWEFELINFVVDNCGSVVESDFYTKLKKIDAHEREKDKIRVFADHATQVCEAHDRVIVSFVQQVQGLARATTEGSRENIGPLGAMCTCEEM